VAILGTWNVVPIGGGGAAGAGGGAGCAGNNIGGGGSSPSYSSITCSDIRNEFK